ncbi:MAG TPA: aromatic ring-hydroxylating dioxygenase subunit alpha [Alphaproteobacteria bacterium]|nr:aromatic ring-hydroxylating dioxygenase subunit alpha [Alphaproteobacteria bacterium]
MSKATSTTQEVEKLLTMGLRDRWYPVAASWMVGRKPVGLTRLGERLVLWRDEAGAVHALEDRCPHRGARLSLGWNLGDRLACWYHGVEVTADGTVARVPAAEKCPLEGQHCVRSYPCQEHHGGIFAWFGRDPQAAPLPLELPEELASPEWSSMLCTAAWKCNYSYAVDNVMDPMHGAYLHAASHSMAHGDKTAVMRIRKTQHGLMFEKETQRDVNFDWTEWGDTGAQWMRLSIPYRKDAGPGGMFFIIGFVTPVDETHCRVFFWRCRKVQGWQRGAWRFLYRARLEGLHWDVLEQDRVVLESMAADARDHEFLYAHDTGMAHVRRLLRKEAEAQAARPAAAE